MKSKLGYINILINNNNIDDILKLKNLKQWCEKLIVAIPDEFVYSRLIGEDEYYPDKIKQIILDTGYADNVIYFSDNVLDYQDAWNIYNFDCLFYGSEYGFAFDKHMKFFGQHGVKTVSLQQNYNFKDKSPSPLEYAIEHIKPDNELVLWGAGRYLTLYMRSNLKQPEHIADSNIDILKQNIFNCRVELPETVFCQNNKAFVVLCSTNYRTMKENIVFQNIYDYRTMMYEPNIAILEEYGLSRKDELQYLSNVHKLLKDLLQQFDSVCQKYNLKYYLILGSLLGAIRHNGFIPWDDDIDVAMPRKDFEKFKLIAPKEWDSAKVRLFDIEDYGKDAFCDTMPRLINLQDKVQSKLFRKIINRTDYDLKGRISIDICPLDYACGCRFIHYLQIKKMQLVYALMMGHHDTIEYSKYTRMYSNASLKFLKILNKIGSYIPLKPLISLFKKISERRKSGSLYILSGNTITDIEKRYNTSSFGNGIRVRFEDFFVNIPDEYDKLLLTRYGNYNKLPSLRKRIPAHYYANDLKRPLKEK